MGDFNSRHRLWNCHRANAAGNILFKRLSRNDFVVLHPPTPTHFPADSAKVPSTIDLTLSNDRRQRSELSTHPLGSDHDIVFFKIELEGETDIRSNCTRPCYKKANWGKYASVIEAKLLDFDFNQNNITTTQQIDSLIEILTKTIQEAQQKSVPRVAPDRYALVLSPAITEKIKTRSILERQWQRMEDVELKRLLKTEINSLRREIQLEISALRNMNWAHRLDSLPKDDNRKSLWQLSKFIKNRCQQTPPLKDGNALRVTPQEKSELLASTFAKAHDNPLALEEPLFTAAVECEVDEFLSGQMDFTNVRVPSISDTDEVIRALKTSKSPGLDGINNLLLKKLSRSGVLLLHLIIISCIKLSYFPKIWKIGMIRAIKKPGKPPAEATSYRPISLLSSISKVLERLILKQLREHVEEFQIIPHDQHGFSRGKSTIHQLHRLCSHIKTRFAAPFKHSTGMLLMDVERAFDRVWHAGLLKKMIDQNFPVHLVHIISSFLKERQFMVTVDGAKSTMKAVPFGVPQGSALSPLLYNLYTADVPDPGNCRRALFADDTAFFTSSDRCAVITKNLRETFKTYLEYFCRWKISLNVSKTKAIFFTNRRTREIPHRPLYITNSCRIPWSDEAKYLGLVLDKKLTFQRHIQYAMEKTNKATSILYSLLNRNSTLDTDNKLLLFKVALRPIFSYGCTIFQGAARSHIKKLQVLQNKALKMCLNLPWHTRTSDVHDHAVIEMVPDYFDRIATKFLLQLTPDDDVTEQ